MSLYERQTQFFAKKKNSIVMPIYCCIIVYLNIEWIVHFRFQDFTGVALKNKAYDILRHSIRKQCYLNQTCISLDQRIREDTKLYYGDVNMFDSLEVHDVVLDKLMWEYTKNRINRVFGEDYVQIIDYRMEGYTLKNIAEELGLSASKVSFMFEKVKKWYTTIDS